MSEGDSCIVFWERRSLLVVLIAAGRGLSDRCESAIVSAPKVFEAVGAYAHCLPNIVGFEEQLSG